jgi:hypothetical protein
MTRNRSTQLPANEALTHLVQKKRCKERRPPNVTCDLQFHDHGANPKGHQSD